MKKVLHLICNSHIDPVWQWDWDEGAAATLATFYAACNLLDKYDFVFCHNEVLVYEYIERYDPVLFARIQKLVKEGKWKIMGGWYCQPDCLVPSGESFLRQISLGREYFQEKFNARPRVALNFDSFGHTKGLAQILAKTGYDGYIFCRPDKGYVSLPNFKDYPHGPFLWEGYDGSRIKAMRCLDCNHNYTTPFGKAREGIEKKAEQYNDLDIIPILWGVGNHGGTSSEKDLQDILSLKEDKKGEWELIHSTLEDYFDSVKPTEVEKRQIFVFLKAYSSVHAIKLAHDQLENSLYFNEKLCTVANLKNDYVYNKDVFKNAERALCKIEFHDVLAGTAVKSGTDASIRKANGAMDELKQEGFAAFYSLMSDLPKVDAGDDNVVVFNPYPYDFEGYVESEYYPAQYLPDLNDEYAIEMYDVNHQPIDYQIIKEESNIMVQHRIRVIYKANIPAFSVASYGAKIKFAKKKDHAIDQDQPLVFKDKYKTISISKKTGLIESYQVDGKEYLSAPGFSLMSFNDNADPWGWRLHNLTNATFNEFGWPQPETKNSLKAMKLDNSGKGLFEGIPAIKIIEDGKYLTEVQVFFTEGDSHAVVNYKIYKDSPYVDINVHLLWAEAHRGLKVKLPLNGDKKYFTQMAFGKEIYAADGIENAGNRYVGVNNGDKCFAIYNRSGIHSYSKKGKDLYVTLLNGAAYCAHPTVPDIKLTQDGRYVPYADQGANDFAFRICVSNENECERIANEFNQPIYSVIAFPHNDKNTTGETIKLSNKNIVITCLKRMNDGNFVIRLYNGSNKVESTSLSIKGIDKEISFKKFVFKTFVFDGSSIKESKDSSIY